MMFQYYLMAIKLGDSKSMYNLGLHYELVEKDYGLMSQYYLMAIKLDHAKTIKKCVDNNYFVNDEIKNAIVKKIFTVVDENIFCPITHEETAKCYVTKCNHKFSSEITKCKICPLCRSDIL